LRFERHTDFGGMIFVSKPGRVKLMALRGAAREMEIRLGTDVGPETKVPEREPRDLRAVVILIG
jgi:hypothetical protein